MVHSMKSFILRMLESSLLLIKKRLGVWRGPPHHLNWGWPLPALPFQGALAFLGGFPSAQSSFLFYSQERYSFSS